MSSQELEVFIRTHAGVKSIKEMARETFSSTGRITKIASNLKICLKDKEQVRKRQELEEAIRLNHKTMTAIQIAGLVNQPIATVNTRGFKMGLKFKVTKVHKPKTYVPEIVLKAKRMPAEKFITGIDEMWWTAGYERTA
jgi:hypothetical protein